MGRILVGRIYRRIPPLFFLYMHICECCMSLSFYMSDVFIYVRPGVEKLYFFIFVEYLHKKRFDEIHF